MRWIAAAFLTPRQRHARGLPPRAPTARLSRRARTLRGLVSGVEVAWVLCAGGAHGITAAQAVAASLLGLLACHVLTSAIESHPASLRARPLRP